MVKLGRPSTRLRTDPVTGRREALCRECGIWKDAEQDFASQTVKGKYTYPQHICTDCFTPFRRADRATERA